MKHGFSISRVIFLPPPPSLLSDNFDLTPEGGRMEIRLRQYFQSQGRRYFFSAFVVYITTFRGIRGINVYSALTRGRRISCESDTTYRHASNKRRVTGLLRLLQLSFFLLFYRGKFPKTNGSYAYSANAKKCVNRSCIFFFIL